MIESASLGLRVNLTFIDSRVTQAGIGYPAISHSAGWTGSRYRPEIPFVGAAGVCWHELETVGVGRLPHGENVQVRLSDPGHLQVPVSAEVCVCDETDRSVAEVPHSALQYDGPAQGGVDQRPAGVDEVRRGLRVYQLVREVLPGPGLRLTQAVCKVMTMSSTVRHYITSYAIFLLLIIVHLLTLNSQIGREIIGCLVLILLSIYMYSYTHVHSTYKYILMSCLTA